VLIRKQVVLCQSTACLALANRVVIVIVIDTVIVVYKR
jgi:hypothetical protein